MNRKYVSRAETLADCPPILTWPVVLDDLINANHREKFNKKCKAVEMYIDGYSIIEIQNITEIKSNSISGLVQKCTRIAPDGRIFGYRALIPFLNFKEYERTANQKFKSPEAQGGLSGVFVQTLKKFPKVSVKLIQYINKEYSKEINVHEKKIRAKDLHRLFLSLLKEQGVDKNQWPFNTKHLGFKTIQKYLDQVLNESFAKTVSNREEHVASAHLAVGTGHTKFLTFEEPYEVVQLDAYSINAFFTAEFQTPENINSDIQLERIWLIAMIEAVSGAILAQSIIYRSEISADDVLGVIRKAVNPTDRLQLTIPGLKYPDNSGIPNEVFPQCLGALWGTIMLDGALAHLSNTIHERVRKKLGFSINWGPAAHFERRPDIERYFARISKDLFMRLPSTTGSNPGNGRAKKAEQKAVTYKIRAHEAEELAAVFVAQHNETPSEGTFYNSPLEVLKHYIEDNKDHFLLRKHPVKSGGNLVLIPLIKTAIVRGGRETGRRPYIQLYGVRYTNPVLSSTSGLLGKKLTLEIDENDLTYCKAYFSEGGEIGILKALGNWGATKHSLKTRKIINSLITKKQLVISSQQDPIQVYLDSLSVRQKTKSKNKPAIKPRAATEATRVAKESGLPRKIIDKKIHEPEIHSNFNSSSSNRVQLMNKPMPDLNMLIKGKK